MSEVVRRRLEVLLAEVPPRRSMPEAADGEELVVDLPSRREESATTTGPHREPDAPTEATVSVLRWRVARRHAIAIVALVLGGCLWTGYWLLAARTTEVAVAVTTGTPSTGAGTPTAHGSPAQSTSSSASAPARLMIHVIGAVRRPGVVRLPAGSRVFQAIEAAGGLTSNADPGELNFAAVLSDGSQIVIGRRGRPRGELRGQPSTGPTESGASIDLNSATETQLDTLPGVGPVTAAKIVAWRAAHGRFSRVEELQEVDGIGPKSYAEIAPHVRV